MRLLETFGLREKAIQAISDLVGEIYECVLRPNNWQRVIERLCAEMQLMYGVLGLYSPKTGQPLLRIQHGMPQHWFDLMPSYAFKSTTFWGGAECVQGYPVGEVIVHSVAHPNYDYTSNRFAKEWCVPQGIRDFAALSVSAEEKGIGTLVFTSNRQLEVRRKDELELLRLLAPHIRRTIKISELLDFQTFQQNSLRLAVDALPNGVLLLSAQRHLVHLNAAAAAALKTNDAIKIVDGRLTMRDPQLAAALDAAINPPRNGHNLSERGGGIPARGSNGSRAMLHVLPLASDHLRGKFSTAAAAAVFLAVEGDHCSLPKDALRVLYDLTPAEIRVCELLLDGMTAHEAAELTGVAVSTIRTHLLRIFEKTGVNRQADLIRKITPLMVHAQVRAG